MLENWIIEVSSGYVGYRNTVTLEWINSDVANELMRLENLIEKSSYIKDLKFSWDDDGAKIIEVETWNKSVKILENIFEEVRKNYNKYIILPDINPCRNGSIDISFDSKGYALLINISDEGIYYYGCFRKFSLLRGEKSIHYSEEIKGSVEENLSIDLILIQWIVKNLTNG